MVDYFECKNVDFTSNESSPGHPPVTITLEPGSLFRCPLKTQLSGSDLDLTGSGLDLTESGLVSAGSGFQGSRTTTSSWPPSKNLTLR